MKFYLDLRDKETKIDDLLSEYPISGVFTNSSKNSIDKTLIVKQNNIYREDKLVGKILFITNPEQMSEALGEDINEDLELYLIETADWHIIPIENLIAKFDKSNVDLIATARTPEEVNLVKGILEIGVDGCLLVEDDYNFETLIETALEKIEKFELTELKVVSIGKMGSGDRVCVDTCSILREGEGLLVGSTAAVQVLVQAEVEESGFVNSRPFRVNAGVVASYVLNGNNTNYLSELKAGSNVMIVDREGRSRNERVARVKIERRPLLLLQLAYEDREYPVILQDAETVKLVTKDGSVRVNELETGTTVLGKISTTGRHFGMEVDEFIEER